MMLSSQSNKILFLLETGVLKTFTNMHDFSVHEVEPKNLSVHALTSLFVSVARRPASWDHGGNFLLSRNC